MTELQYTLLTDGASDRALIPILTWLLRQHGTFTSIQATWAELSRLPRPPKRAIDRIRRSVELYPCDLLFVHRDAEKDPHELRVAEIRRALEQARQTRPVAPAVPVVSVRMQEAWLLFDEAAIRQAAGNSRGRHRLDLPAPRSVEDEPDPKWRLHELLRDASGHKGRRRQKFHAREYAARVTEFISDFSPLRALPAFRALETEVEQVVQDNGW